MCVVVVVGVGVVVQEAWRVLCFLRLALSELQWPHAGVGVITLLHGEGVHVVSKQPTCPLCIGKRVMTKLRMVFSGVDLVCTVFKSVSMGF